MPVLVLSCVYIYLYHFHQFRHLAGRRPFALIVSLLLFYCWVVIGIKKRKQESATDILVQSSFYVFIFSVLTLTGYFIFFNEVSAHNWWQNMAHRVNVKDGVNLTPFLFLKARHLLKYETVGNFFMLLPLGIYLPLMYKRTRDFLSVVFVAMLVSVCIELMQLATNSRVTDIDDVILNTSGALVGFIFYFIFYRLMIKPMNSLRQYSLF